MLKGFVGFERARRFAGSVGVAMDESGWAALCESAGGAVGAEGRSGAPSFAQVLANFEKSAEARERELLTLDCMPHAYSESYKFVVFHESNRIESNRTFSPFPAFRSRALG